MPAKKKAPAKKRTVSASHKAAMATGREEGRTVRAYLEALEANKPKRGRKRTPESIRARLDGMPARIEAANPLKKLELAQETIDLTAELRQLEAGGPDLSGLEKDFTKVAKGYASRKGISYDAWRAVGVQPSVLKTAGISRGS